tara:strand:+ start:74 stop:664 length:591 start_codon:yes stop_codon:yes gene_type:complete
MTFFFPCDEKFDFLEPRKSITHRYKTITYTTTQQPTELMAASVALSDAQEMLHLLGVPRLEPDWAERTKFAAWHTRPHDSIAQQHMALFVELSDVHRTLRSRAIKKACPTFTISVYENTGWWTSRHQGGRSPNSAPSGKYTSEEISAGENFCSVQPSKMKLKYMIKAMAKSRNTFAYSLCRLWEVFPMLAKYELDQ